MSIDMDAFAAARDDLELCIKNEVAARSNLGIIAEPDCFLKAKAALTTSASTTAARELLDMYADDRISDKRMAVRKIIKSMKARCNGKKDKDMLPEALYKWALR